MRSCVLCAGQMEQEGDGHKACLKKLFGVTYWPRINFGLQDLALKAQDMAGKLSISGVQAKVSVKLNRKSKELEIVAQQGEIILKPQIDTFPRVPQNENLCMNMALNLGIAVPPHALVQLKDKSWAYVVKRFDRAQNEKFHQEDFCQILGEDNKYKGSLERVGKKLWEISDVPGLDVQLFFERVLFFFMIGNGDAHLKNFSMLYDSQGRMRLSPAYDIACSKLVIPDEEDMALSLNGRKNKITKRDFDHFAEALKIRSDVGYKKILGKKDLIIQFIKESTHLLDEEKTKWLDIAQERARRVASSSD